VCTYLPTSEDVIGNSFHNFFFISASESL